MKAPDNGSDRGSRLSAFGADIVRQTGDLPGTVAGRLSAGQLRRSATSAAPPCEEARGAGSRADFGDQPGIARGTPIESRIRLK
ncbi:MAG: four helix bundle protein [Opitutaceae bacterium]|nr:four helix bundle protein [Opitutaceae bacterium]